MSIYSIFETDIRNHIEEINELPTLPHVSQELLALRDKTDAGGNELVHILEYDPILCAQLVRFASTPLFSSRKATNIQDAINRLGFDHALSLALGLATGKHFSAPMEGPIGLIAFWRHAVYSATLMQLLSLKLNKEHETDIGLIYLAGLLHNIGFLLFAHQFPAEYKVLNQMIKNNEGVPVLDVEKTCIGASHNEIGLWLMRKWNLPKPVMTAIYEHHNTNYRGEHAVYANLALIADRALKNYGIGDATIAGQDEELLDRLGLTHAHLEESLETIMAEKQDMESFIQTMLS
jgi:HD-like signal output (HDOD) protein